MFQHVKPSNLIPIAADPMTAENLMSNTENSALRSDYVKVKMIKGVRFNTGKTDKPQKWLTVTAVAPR